MSDFLHFFTDDNFNFAKKWGIFKTEKNRENVADLLLLVVDNFNFAEKLSKIEKWSFVSSVCEKG